MVAVGIAAWSGCLLAAFTGWWGLTGVGILLAAAGRWPRQRTTLLVLALVCLSTMACLALRQQTIETSPVEALARERAVGEVEFVVRSDPRLWSGRFGERVMFRAEAVMVTARGKVHRVRTPVLVSGSVEWVRVRLGATVAASARLGPSLDPDTAAVISVRGSPVVTAEPAWWWRPAERAREGIRIAVADQPPGPRALVPALVDGDDARMDPTLVDDFRTTGLTHLTAVSGTNLTLIVGFLLILARGVGIQARGLMIVGALGVVGFVLLARTEPSVVRAAVMGSVALLGMGLGRVVGTRTLGVAVTFLMLFDPWLATTPGFVLSVSATAGILFLSPGWRDRMARWMPRWAAEALSVPLAAQLACTPMVAALSGEVSIAAVVANVLVAPVVGPVTVFGLLGGLIAMVWEAGGQLVAAPGALSARWIIWVATHGSDLPTPAFEIGTSPTALVVLTLACVALAFACGPLLGRPSWTIAAASCLVLVVLVPAPRIGWPPPRWVAVMCDVGQGDGLVIRTGPGEALVVDVGPEPQLIDGCLDRLGIDRLTAVVLTHFHADHVDGLDGVLAGREVAAVVVSTYAEPAAGAGLVHAAAAAHHVPVVAARFGEQFRRGPVRWQVLAPSGPPPVGSQSPPNDASVVLLVEVRGVRLLLTGDQEDGSQQELARTFPDLRADVLKVAHHGSAKQDGDLIRGLGARLALISVDVDNDYGHPAPSLMRLLDEVGLEVRRTDLHGDIALVVDDGLRVVTSR